MSSEPDGDYGELTGQPLVARELRLHRERAGLSRNELATRVGYSRSYISTCEKPGATLVSEAVVSRIDQELRAGGLLIALQAQADSERKALRTLGDTVGHGAAGSRQERAADSDVAARHASGVLGVASDARDAGSTVDGIQVEYCRQALHDVLTDGGLSQASIDDWELTVLRYGIAAKDRAPALLLAELTDDFGVLQAALTRCRSSVALRRLTRVAAQLSGLMCLTLIKIDDRSSFRRWTRTARTAAAEADDPVTYSWVLAQEAYGHFYSDDLVEAVTVARHAQVVAARASAGQRVGGVLAAALEARAHAVCGRATDTVAALRVAEAMLVGLDHEATGSTAFGYNEAQFRFHESNAMTHLGDSKAAWIAQDRALALVAPDDFMDRTFTHLDRAMCLAADGDAVAATTYALDKLHHLSPDQRHGIIDGRTADLLRALSPAQRSIPAARELQDLLEASARKAR